MCVYVYVYVYIYIYIYMERERERESRLHPALEELHRALPSLAVVAEKSSMVYVCMYIYIYIYSIWCIYMYI